MHPHSQHTEGFLQLGRSDMLPLYTSPEESGATVLNCIISRTMSGMVPKWDE